MKLRNTLICQFFIVAVVSSLSISVANGQGGEATTGDSDAHPTVDSPYLRPKPKPAASAGAAQSNLSAKDKKFLSQIAAGGAQAVEDSKAIQKSASPAVKNVATRIVNERSKSNAELVALAKKKGVSLAMEKVKARNLGSEKQYVHTIGHDLDEDVQLLSAASQSSDDKEIKAWAGKTLPMVKAHDSAVKQAGGKG